MITFITSLLILTSGLYPLADDWKKDRPVASFKGLKVGNGIDVYLSQGKSEKLILQGTGVNERLVKSFVKKGILYLDIKRRRFRDLSLSRANHVKAYITFKQLVSLHVSGGADLYGQGVLTFNKLELGASGGSDIKLTLKANQLDVDANGGSDAILQGSAQTLYVSGSGGSELDARKLTSDVCWANSSGGADVYINASQKLSMQATGGSDIYYYGPAKVVSKSKSGGSDITQKH
ncbi:head GIN domain-containing protein [Spirosoma sp. KNUC1025]|uniref:head GIN domain-containing protein n=1 Tax=Spirosoma sp. KNUC1025 TaxID=2894082 RepID=UPI00386AAAB1|nr:DUF2807 domain-containing protein [Spirosoma sp. KNUC1025]